MNPMKGTKPEPGALRRSAQWSAHLAGASRNIVQAAAENTSTFATMTGHALINTPYSAHNAAPNI